MQLFKQKQTVPVTAVGPARHALDTHLSKMSSLDATRRALHERSGALASVIVEEARVAQERAQLEQSIDARAVAAVVRGDATPALTEDRARLQHLTARHTQLKERADVARKARAELQAKSESLLAEYRPLQPQLSRLVVDALMERMQALAPALTEAEVAFRKVHRQVFLYACAIDQLSITNRMGIFLDCDRYEQLTLQLPKVPPFDSLSADRFAMHDDLSRLHTEAEQLIGRIMRGEIDEPSPSQAAN